MKTLLHPAETTEVTLKKAPLGAHAGRGSG